VDSIPVLEKLRLDHVMMWHGLPSIDHGDAPRAKLSSK
jgi:hypothetical protein